jgi:hypothetical protein
MLRLSPAAARPIVIPAAFRPIAHRSLRDAQFLRALVRVAWLGTAKRLIANAKRLGTTLAASLDSGAGAPARAGRPHDAFT